MQSRSAIAATEKQPEFKTKNQLLEYVKFLSPTWRNLRILTKPFDERKAGHEVAVCEQDQNGKLTVLVGAPTLTLAGSFYKVAVDGGQIK